MRSDARICSLLLLGTAVAPGAALSAPTAPNPAPSTVSVRATASQLFELAARLEQRGDSRSAVAVLGLLEKDPNPDVRNAARSRHAVMMEADGRDQDAAILLRKVLDEKPDAAAARLKLATMLQKMGDEGAALRELRALRTIDLPPTVARFVDRLSASLQATKPVGSRLNLRVLPTPTSTARPGQTRSARYWENSRSTKNRNQSQALVRRSAEWLRRARH